MRMGFPATAVPADDPCQAFSAKAVLHYQVTSLFMDIPLSELAAHITEQGNPGNHRGVTIAQVLLPAEFLRRGFTFIDKPGIDKPGIDKPGIDTPGIDKPGIGSAIAANTRTPRSFLPEADAFIPVTSHDSPLSDEEAGVLAWAGAAGRPLFAVLNKQVVVDAPARVQALEYVRGETARLGAGPQLRLFPLSSRDALKARLTHIAGALAASGLRELEAALIDFLVHDQRRVSAWHVRADCGAVRRAGGRGHDRPPGRAARA